MNYIERNLIAGERVLYRTRLHWIVMIWFAVSAGIFGLAGLFLLIKAIVSIGDKHSSPGALSAGGLLLCVLAAAAVLTGILKRKATEMAVTNKRVIVKVGLATNKMIELFLTKVEGVIVDQSFWGRMLGYGSIVVRGTGGTAEPFERIARPLEFRRQIEQQIDASQAQTRAASAPTSR